MRWSSPPTACCCRRALLDAGRHGALNIHASLLPRWRGAAPIQRALLAGDRETGDLDHADGRRPRYRAGAAAARIAIAPDDDAGTLHDQLAALGAEAIVAALAEIEAGARAPCRSRENGVTYARKIDKRETRLDWSRPASSSSARCARSGPRRAHSRCSTASRSRSGAPRGGRRAARRDGLESQDGLVIACGEQALAVSELQRAGGRRLSAAEFLRGHPLAPGARFDVTRARGGAARCRAAWSRASPPGAALRPSSSAGADEGERRRRARR